MPPMVRWMKAKQRRAEVNVQVDRYVRILQRVGTLPGGVPGRGEDEMKGKRVDQENRDRLSDWA